MDDKKNQELSPLLRALRTGAIIIILIWVYAFAVEKTNINLEEPLDPHRQETAHRALRSLARPEFFTLEEERRSMDIKIRMPCEGELQGAQTSLGERVATLAPNCASTTQEVLSLTGTGFRPRTSILLRWHAPGEIATTRALTTVRTDAEGNFSVEFSMPDIRPTDEPQRIEVEEKWSTGIDGLSDSSISAIDKILETILLALLATTWGTMLALPLSFIAARNLMINVTSPLAAIMAGVIAIPIGGFVGAWIARQLVDLATTLVVSNIVGVIALVVIVGAAVALFRWEPAGSPNSLIDRLRLPIGGVLLLIAANLAGLLMAALGSFLIPTLGRFGFLGGFFEFIGEFILIASPAFIGFIAAMVAMSFGSRYGQELVLRLSDNMARILNIVLAFFGTAVLIYGIGRGLHWLYVFDDPAVWSTWPALIGGGIAAIVAIFLPAKRPMRIGFTLYSITRALMNIIRSIEPLVYVIVFAVWVGIGPFAGVLALSLHTMAALGKLFSEQVESISEGPIEAITATGANRLQTIIYAVVPQIIPPYIAFTFYRWDINVRVSTILGFGGGGGIGFILFQAINLLQYRKASVYMIAIAVVVMTLDYISARLRSQII